MDDILKQFREKFIEEALDLIKELEKSLIQLENNAEDKHAIEKVFRFAHTLKGVSGMYDFNKIADYTHRLETLFSNIQNGLLTVNTEIIDLTLQSADHVKNLLFDPKFENPENQKKQIELLEKINFFVKDDNNEKQNIINKKNIGKNKTYYICFFPDENLLERRIKITNIFKDFAEIGSFEIFKHEPGIVDEEELDNTEAWGIILSTQESEERIGKAFMFIEDNYKLYKLSDDNIFEENLENQTQDLETEDNPFQIEDLQKFSQKELIKILEESEVSEIKNNLREEQSKEIKESISNRFLSQRINVDTAKLDTLMFLVSEFVTSNAQLKLGFKNSDMNQLKTVVEKMEKLSKQFRNNAFSLRLIPVQEKIFRFQRLVRDLSHKLEKQIKFEIQGGETELDKSILDKLTEPLMHIVRNSIDHGIELPEVRKKAGKPEIGTIVFKTQHSSNNVIISIEDDGCGIDEQKIIRKAIEKEIIPADKEMLQQEIFDLIFLPGFSTAESLTEISGRGVGMDVVKRKIKELRGDISIHSEKGKGTKFIIKLQQTISIIDTMLFKVAEMFFIIPISDIEKCDLIEQQNIQAKDNTKTITFQDKLIPYIDLYELYDLKKPDKKKLKLMVLKKQENYFAIVVDNIIGEHQAVLKSLGKEIKNQKNIAGVSVLGDGSLAYLIDISSLQ